MKKRDTHQLKACPWIEEVTSTTPTRARITYIETEPPCNCGKTQCEEQKGTHSLL